VLQLELRYSKLFAFQIIIGRNFLKNC